MKDLKQQSDGDLDLSGGDINIIDKPDTQHQRDILLMNKGELKHAPLTGVGVMDFLNDDNPEALMDETRRQFIKDKMHVNSVAWTENGLEVEAYYATSNS